MVVLDSSRYPRRQGSIEKSNQNVKYMSQACMINSKSEKISIGLNFDEISKK